MFDYQRYTHTYSYTLSVLQLHPEARFHRESLCASQGCTNFHHHQGPLSAAILFNQIFEDQVLSHPYFVIMCHGQDMLSSYYIGYGHEEFPINLILGM